MSWRNDWIEAEPLYKAAAQQFRQRGQLSRALYAEVSETPAESESSVTLPEQIATLRHDLTIPAARAPNTRLRILTILGMLEVNYDAGMARNTWSRVEMLAIQQRHFLLASRAVGEQGIANFLLGNIATAKKDVVRAWVVAKIVDPAAQVRYASVYGAALVQLHRYREALGPIDQAIQVAKRTPGIAYPSIAVTAKIEALSGLGRNSEAMALASSELKEMSRYRLVGHLYELYQTKAKIDEHAEEWDQAISDLMKASACAQHLFYWRGLTQADGLLAIAYVHQGKLKPALVAIDEAIKANEQIPDEMYFVPKNLAIKARVMARLGRLNASNNLYAKSADMLDALLSKVPTPSIERHLINDLREVYAGYFASLIEQGKLAEAFQVIERARGRVEDQALTDHAAIIPHSPSPMEQHLTALNVELLNTDNATARAHILNAIYSAEQQLDPRRAKNNASPKPVSLSQLQRDLTASELFVEYVLAKPQSYVLAVSKNTTRCYALPARNVLEQDARHYRNEIVHQRTDRILGQRLFHELLGKIREFSRKRALIIVPDGDLHLLPFSALINNGRYILESHRITVVPSGTVFDILRHRQRNAGLNEISYLGVAAWTSRPPKLTLLASVRRAIVGPERSEFVALPESRYEVDTVASYFPKPETVLLGDHATETNFKRLHLYRYNVIHLALHGYVNTEYPDRSALIFAPETPPIDDGLLQVREIRNLHLNASLVTLSACSTGVGPVGEEGIANIENAFIDAGARSVVATLWGVEDQPTAQLMVNFYSHLSNGEQKAKALWQAKLQMMDRGVPPYFWAGFVLDGDPNGSLFKAKQDGAALKGIQ